MADTDTDTRQRAASQQHRRDDVLAVLWSMGWRLADGSRLWLTRDNPDAAKELGLVIDAKTGEAGYLRAVISDLTAEGRMVKLQRGLWQIKKPRQPRKKSARN